jgi:hypothetical protein
MTTQPDWTAEVRSQIADVRAWLADVEQKLDRVSTVVSKLPTTTVDEDVAAATSATAVQKALERELGIDRRTVLAKAERVVKAHDVEAKLPGWSTDLRFWKYLAERQPSGNVRLIDALFALSTGAAT